MHLNKSKVTRQWELLGVRGPSRGKVLRRHYSQGPNMWEMFVVFLEGHVLKVPSEYTRKSPK